MEKLNYPECCQNKTTKICPALIKLTEIPNPVPYPSGERWALDRDPWLQAEDETEMIFLRWASENLERIEILAVHKRAAESCACSFHTALFAVICMLEEEKKRNAL